MQCWALLRSTAVIPLSMRVSDVSVCYCCYAYSLYMKKYLALKIQRSYTRSRLLVKLSISNYLLSHTYD